MILFCIDNKIACNLTSVVYKQQNYMDYVRGRLPYSPSI